MAPNLDGSTPLKEAWLFEAHVDQTVVTSSTISDAIADSVSAKYEAWQESRAATMSAGTLQRENSLKRKSKMAGVATTLTYVATTLIGEEEREEDGAAAKECTHTGGMDWSFPSQLIDSGKIGYSGIISDAIKKALSEYRRDGVLVFDPANNNNKEPFIKNMNKNLAASFPDADEDSASWGIKCGTMYAGCPADEGDGKCGLMFKLRNVKVGNCAFGKDDHGLILTKIGVLDTETTSFSMPEHGKVMVGFASLNPKYVADESQDITSKAAKQAGLSCSGTEREQYLSDLDAALRIGMAKARFDIGKKVEGNLFELKDAAKAKAEAEADAAGRRRRRRKKNQLQEE